MPKKLLEIATELNVGTSTIIEHLTKSGFSIENKPNAKITDEMYNELLKEFQKSIAIKEQADQLKFRGQENKPQPVHTSIFGKKEESSIFGQKLSKPAAPEKPAETVQEKPAVEETVAPETRSKPASSLKVVGKIDLDAPKAKKETKSSKAKAPEGEPAKEEAPVPETPKEKVEEVAPTEDFYKAEAPQLKGLKILGKIDTDKLDKPKKAKEEPAKDRGDVRKRPGQEGGAIRRDQAATPSGESTGSDDAGAKKKRKRKKVNVAAEGKRLTKDNKRVGMGGGSEISKKEIDDNIRTTFARLSGPSGKKRKQRLKKDKRELIREKQLAREMEGISSKLQVTEFISVSELAGLMNVPATEVITACMNLGVFVSINQRLDAEIIELVADEFGFEVEFINLEEQTIEEEDFVDDPEDLKPRPPIVTVMGHVDHGKTSLLDNIRKSNVVAGEAGGITQHIGAYEVVLEGGKAITFLDTPGHEAFTAMRARGAKVTDIAVIIIAADENIMPQTKEAISHAQAAAVPLIFAINKIDKPGADPEKIKQELASMNLLVEEWGGKYQSQDISAKAGLNIDLLLEKILLEAELLDLKANPKRLATGTVIEASLEKGRGYVTKLLVQNGTLREGDPVAVGEYAGKLKAMFNERGKRIKEAGPSQPVLVLGLGGAPQAGEKFKVADSEQTAKQSAAKRSQISREQTTRASKRISLDEIGRRLALGNFKELNLIVKGDVDGSVEALSDSLIKQSIDKVQVNVIHRAVGQIVESDVLLASASDAIIIGFQVRPSAEARRLAEKEGVQIKTYSIIYEAIEEIKLAIQGMLEPTKEESILGTVKVREVFKISKVGTVAGCYVQEGKVTRNSYIRIVRDGIVVYPTKEGAHGEILTLKRFKEDVKEVKSGMECGISVRNFNDIKVDDIIEVYEIIEVSAVK